MPPVGNDVGSRVEALLAQLQRQGGDTAAATGEELVRELVSFYGEGLSHIVGIIAEDNPEVLAALISDRLVESQLILHGLHPLSADQRIERALDEIRPYLGSHAGGVDYLGIDEHGMAHLRLDGSCSGCPSSTVTVKLTITDAVLGAAPELVGIEVEGQTALPDKLLQIGRRPGSDTPVTASVAAPPPIWLHPSARDLPADGFAALADLEGRTILMARLGETYFAYADRCPSCDHSLAGEPGGVALEGDVLACRSCGVRYDARLAGRAIDRPRLHLEPLPLLDDVSGIRIALIPAAV
ncbi:NifU family protein [Sporichthya sp.]|uniref:NifU family protein n=1 Tax=Sporichthya sp. TaxID=65475 RepID=UPI0017F3F4A9|nr:NifU family protein [Sporichthya sp.]MBA3743717.1 NifU family protein [Sporichthya sp.]